MTHNHGPNEWCGDCFKGWVKKEVEVESKPNTVMIERHATKIKKLPMRITQEVGPITKGKPPRL